MPVIKFEQVDKYAFNLLFANLTSLEEMTDAYERIIKQFKSAGFVFEQEPIFASHSVAYDKGFNEAQDASITITKYWKILLMIQIVFHPISDRFKWFSDTTQQVLRDLAMEYNL